MTNTRDAADVIHHSTKHATPALQPLVSFRRRARPTKRVRTWLSAPVQHRVRIRQRVTAGEATHHPTQSRQTTTLTQRPHSTRPHPELTMGLLWAPIWRSCQSWERSPYRGISVSIKSASAVDPSLSNSAFADLSSRVANAWASSAM